jgi:hypothetical protein
VAVISPSDDPLGMQTLGINTRRKSAETMRAALLTNRPQNGITPERY